MTQTERVPPTNGVPPKDDNLGIRYLPDATEEEATAQGWWAYSFGFELADCPYHSETMAGVAWRESWQQSEADDEG